MSRRDLSRRDVIGLGLAAGAGMLARDVPWLARLEAQAAQLQNLPLITKPIPSSGEQIPVIGLGTAQDWGSTPTDQLLTLLGQFPELGGKVVDTAPAYGTSETVLGDVVNRLQTRDRFFLATKVSVGGRGAGGAAGPAAAQQGIASLEESMRRFHTNRIDLMQVWNLGGPDVLLPILREWKQAGRIRYYGVTTTSDRQYPALLDLMRRETLDFVQVDFSINNRNAAAEVLPLAADRGIAVITALPFGRASVFRQVQDKPVPGWASEIDCTTWAQIFLKYLVSHPSVTVAIPGTTSLEHLADNLGAARGRLPDAAMRQRIEREYEAL
jgi:aryl-alcohol dehydrogenase-like predicted oxidoreductase